MKKIPVWKNVILLVSVLVVFIIATLAWFYTRPRADASDMTIHVGKASYLQISGDNGLNWSDEVVLDFGVNKNFKEISGNGTKFYAPVYDNIQLEDGSFSTEIITFEQVKPGEKYYEETFEFRSDAAQDVYLAPESFVVSVDEEGDSYIDGAIRVAFFELDDQGNETLKCIWAPNSLVEYSDEYYAFTREGSVEPYYYYQMSEVVVDADTMANGSSNDAFVKIATSGTDANGCGYNEANKFMWSNGEFLPDAAPVLLTMDEAGEDGLFYKELKIRVWIEGHDRECVSLLSGQRFAMTLQFTAQEGE